MPVSLGKVTVLNRVYNPDTFAWEAMVQPSTGGGSASSTQVSVSNFSTQVSVSGYVAPSTTVAISNFPATQPVSLASVPTHGVTGPLTDAELRATPVPVSASTTVAVSTGSMRVTQSSAADFNVTVAGYVAPSTTVSIANTVAVSGPVTDAQLRATAVPVSLSAYSTVTTVSTGSIRVHQSSAADHRVSAWLFDSTGLSLESSTRSNAASTMRGLAVRSVMPDSTTASGQAAAAGDNTIISSNSQAIYVYAFSWTPVSTAAQMMRWLRGSTSEAWRARVLAPSTVGDPSWSHSMAVSPPAYLFRTSTGQHLVLNVTSSGVSYSVAAWREG